MKIFEDSFSLFINKNSFIQWINEDFAYYLGYQKEDLEGQSLSLIVEGNIKDKLEFPSFYVKLKDIDNQIYEGIFNVSKVFDKMGNHKGYFLQFFFKKDEKSADESLVFKTNNPKMKKILEKVSLIARSNVPVFIHGEIGTGKTSLAKWIHSISHRASFPFVSVNCSALPENMFEIELFGYEKGAFAGANISKAGKIELAENGTLLLDEIGDLSLTSQAKLLNILDTNEFERLGSSKSKKINVRLISTSRKNLLEEYKKNKFRLELLYRLAVVKIELPPLRERKEDIPLLVNNYLASKNKRIKPRALRYLVEQDWYGNITELNGVLETACILAGDKDYIDLEHITDQFIGVEEIDKFQSEEMIEPQLSEEKLFDEKERIKVALMKTNGNRKRAAELLGISVPTLWRKMKKYNLLEEFKKG